jgi:hypothetical protein
MTALTSPTRPRAAAPAGRIPMLWVAWRQHRAALAGTGLLLGAFAVVLADSGLRMRSAYDALIRGHCLIRAGLSGSSGCALLDGNYYHAGYPFTGNIDLMAIALAVLPVLIGMFAGAPLLAREYEAGTARFAWTQAVSRGRWLAAKLVLVGAALAVAGAAFGALTSWWLLLADGTAGGSRWEPQQFGLTAVTFAGWVLLMFAVGVFAGTLLRRTVPAMAATAAAGAVLLWFTIERFTGLLTGIAPLAVRSSLISESLAVSTGPGAILVGGSEAVTPPGGWVLSTWFTGPHGRVIPPFSNSLNALWNGNLSPAAQAAWVARHHLTLWVSYQSAARFWIFETVEGCAAVAIAAVLAAAAIWLARRQAA